MALGAVAAGCKFYSAYPMTPASTILHWMVAHADRCGIGGQASARTKLRSPTWLSAPAWPGARSMCATSGGGFALMTEAVGQAGMIEAPVVFITVQRGGPSTGIPTKTEQADLNQALGASQGDFPRIIMAPADVTEAYYTAAEALNLADKYQLPVIILSDLLLSEHPETIERDALQARPGDRPGPIGDRMAGRQRHLQGATPSPNSGISPRARPGTKNTVHVAPTDDHDEEGILISDEYTSPPVRRKVQEKRMKKLEGALKELPPPQIEGPEGCGRHPGGLGVLQGRDSGGRRDSEIGGYFHQSAPFQVICCRFTPRRRWKS